MNPVQEQLDAYNSRDIERFLACYSTDAVVEDASGTVLLRGIESLRRAYEKLFTSSPALAAVVRWRMFVGEYVVDDELVNGINLPGSPSEIHAVVIYHVRHGKIVNVRSIS